MGITTVPSVVTGQTYSAANYNTQVRDNINGIWVCTTAGDMIYASSSSAASRLALVTGGILIGGASAPSWLANSAGKVLLAGATSPAWLAHGAARQSLQMNSGATAAAWSNYGNIHKVGYMAYDAGGQEITSTSYTNVTNSTMYLNTTVTCTILMFATGKFGSDSATTTCYARPVLAGAYPADDSGSAALKTGGVGTYPYTTMFYYTGVAAGNNPYYLQVKSSNGGKVYNDTGQILVIAIGE